MRSISPSMPSALATTALTAIPPRLNVLRTASLYLVNRLVGMDIL